MTEQAQNALLKTLEEPPEYGVIILTASNPETLLETVRSRCAVTRFSAYTAAEVEYILENSEDVPSNADIGLYARLSGNNPGYAIELAGSGAFLSERDELIGLFCELLNGRPESFFLLSSFPAAKSCHSP
jgi:DNA polymerase-3 subunit delta'